MIVGSVILAAGKSKRMKSAIPKVIHNLMGKPMISYAIEAAQAVSDIPPVVIVGHAHETVKANIIEEVGFALQEEQLGTAHAVMMAKSQLQGKTDLIVITNADMPLITKESLQELVDVQKNNPGPMSLTSICGEESRGFGRVVRDNSGKVTCIVEEKVATPEQLNITEYNAGFYCFRSAWLWDALEKVEKSEVGEFYLTDLLEIAVKEGGLVEVVTIQDPNEAIGVNNRVHFAEVERIIRQRINDDLMLSGVTMVDPQRVYVESTVTIGQDTVLYPDTYLHGDTKIGKNCKIGPETLIQDTQIGDDCTILKSVLEGAILEDHVEMGPYCHLRKDAHLAAYVHMGNFGEVKKSYLGEGTKMGHFSYIGDAKIGKDVNIGAGTITCNYDGKKKNKTVIGDNTFIGSDTMLVAPIEIGKNAVTGAGAVVNKNVADGEKVVGVPAHPIKKKNKGT